VPSAGSARRRPAGFALRYLLSDTTAPRPHDARARQHVSASVVRAASTGGLFCAMFTAVIPLVSRLITTQTRRTWLALAVIAAVGATAYMLATKGSDPNPLRWPSPALKNPVVLHASARGNHFVLPTTRDYVIVVPRPRLLGTLWIEGGHNVVVVGGHITVPSWANQRDNGADDTDTGIYVEGASGTVHLEGLLIDGMPDVMFDAIDINAPRATVEIERVRVNGLYGSDLTEHADAVQTWGGVRDLLIDELSVVGDYQGLTINPALGPVGDEEVDDADLTLQAVPAPLRAISVGGGHMVWLTRGAHSCESGQVRLSDVYVDDEIPRKVLSADTVWPARNSSLPCRARVRGGVASWPRLPVSGAVALSAPPGGPFVPTRLVGANYRRSTFSAFVR
jgi:hypothetical protein